MSDLDALRTLLELRRRREQRAGEVAGRRRAAAASAEIAVEQATAALARHDDATLALQRSHHLGLVDQPFSLAALEWLRREVMVAAAARLDLEAATEAAGEALSSRRREYHAAQALHRERRLSRIRLEQACEERARQVRRRRESRLDIALDDISGRRP
ncbi:hypothetical protein WBO78_26965 [Bosea sp. CCNWLW174]|uniref:hypothetical protein n=1 Tax=unclassified Bosea (in: a-proteobacteria) TaxID=2653178 RepID=UPI0030154250